MVGKGVDSVEGTEAMVAMAAEEEVPVDSAV